MFVMMNTMYQREIKPFGLNLVRVSVDSCQVTDHERSWLIFGRLSIEPSSALEGLGHEPNQPSKTKYTLFPPAGVPKLEVN